MSTEADRHILAENVSSREEYLQFNRGRITMLDRDTVQFDLHGSCIRMSTVSLMQDLTTPQHTPAIDKRLDDLFERNKRLERHNHEQGIIIQALCYKLEHDPDVKP